MLLLALVPHLQEVDVIISVTELLQLGLCPPQCSHLPLYLLQLLLSLTDGRSLLDSYQLLHLLSLFLYGADQSGENPLALLHHCVCRVLWRINFSRLSSPSCTSNF